MVPSSPKISKADVLTGNKKNAEFFSDFKTSFKTTPYGNQLIKIKNEEAVKQSLKNLILTNGGERLFQPNLGSGLTNMLFELNFEDNIGLIKRFVENCADNCEPRVQIQEVDIDNTTNENSVVLMVKFNTINNPEPIILDVVLKRVR